MLATYTMRPVQAVNWIPIDVVANLVQDIMFSEDQLTTLLNVVHPQPITWEKTMQDFNTALGISLPLVSIKDWVSKVAEASADASHTTLEQIVCWS